MIEMFVVSEDDLPKFKYKAPEEHSIEENHKDSLLEKQNTTVMNEQEYGTEVKYEETNHQKEAKEEEDDDQELDRQKTIDIKLETFFDDAPQPILEQ